MSGMKQRLLVSMTSLAAATFVALACAGGAAPAASAPALAQPVAPTQPVPAAPAPEPQAARPPAGQAAPAPAPAPRAAAPPSSALGDPKYGGIAVFAHRGDPPVAWDPNRTDTLTLHSVSNPVYGSGNLVKPCRGDVYKICPALAESWESNKDFTQWTFKIRDNARWHDGKLFTANDAKFWLELAFLGAKVGEKTRSPAIFRADLGEIKQVEALPGNRLRVTLGRPSPFYPEVLGNPRYTIAHPLHLMQPRIQQGEVSLAPQDVNWVATGPFKMAKYEKGSLVQLRRFEGYWEKDEQGRRLPFLDGMDFPIIRDPSAMDAAFRVGRLDSGGYGTGPYLSKERQAGYIRDLGDKVWFAEIAGARSGLGFNVIKPGPLQDLRVRRAISLWTDKEAYIASVLGGFGYLHPLLHPKNPFSSPDFMTWPGWNKATRQQDRGEAKRLLAEAGYPNGFQMEFPCRRAHIVQCEFWMGQLAELGVDVKIRLFDDTIWIANTRLSTDYLMMQGGLAAYFQIPEQTEADLAVYSVSKYGVVKHEDPKFTDFFQRLNSAGSFEQRVKVWRELERYFLLEQVYAVPGAGILAVVPYRSHVKGVVVPAENTYNDLDRATVWLDK